MMVRKRVRHDLEPLARELIEHDLLHEERRELIEYYLGDITPGASLARFLEACRRLAARRDELWAQIQELEGPGTGEPT